MRFDDIFAHVPQFRLPHDVEISIVGAAVQFVEELHEAERRNLEIAGAFVAAAVLRVVRDEPVVGAEQHFDDLRLSDGLSVQEGEGGVEHVRRTPRSPVVRPAEPPRFEFQRVDDPFDHGCPEPVDQLGGLLGQFAAEQVDEVREDRAGLRREQVGGGLVAPRHRIARQVAAVGRQRPVEFAEKLPDPLDDFRKKFPAPGDALGHREQRKARPAQEIARFVIDPVAVADEGERVGRAELRVERFAAAPFLQLPGGAEILFGPRPADRRIEQPRPARPVGAGRIAARVFGSVEPFDQFRARQDFLQHRIPSSVRLSVAGCRRIL